MHQLTGGCACGNFSVRLTLTKPPQDYTARQCGCSFCVSHGGTHISDPLGLFEVSVADESLWNKYRFGTGTCDFLICTKCDGYLGAVGDTPTGFRGVIDIRCLDGSEVITARTPSDFEGESVEDRLARRGRNWTPASLKVGGRKIGP